MNGYNLKKIVASPWVWFFAITLISWNLNGVFPFWRYDMYSPSFREVSSIIFLSNGVKERLEDFTDFSAGLNDEKILKDYGFGHRYINIPCDGHEKLPSKGRFLNLEALRGYINAHPNPVGSQSSDRAAVELGLRTLRWDPGSNRILWSDRSFWRATARKKP